MNNLTLIIPAKNESESLPKVIKELNSYNYKISVVLHETDYATIESIKEFDIEIIYQKNKGYGDALIEGIKKCKTDLFCIFNADGSSDTLYFPGIEPELGPDGFPDAPCGIGVQAEREAYFVVTDNDQIILVSDKGQIIRVSINQIRIAGRSTKGVNVFKIPEFDRIVSVSRIQELNIKSE